MQKKADSMSLAVKTQENTIKKTFDKRFAIPLDSDYFKHPVYPYGLKEDLIVRLELNSSENVILCTGDTSATYKLSDISLEYATIFDEPYATTIGEVYIGTTSIPYTKVTSIHYQTLSKKDTTWKIEVNKSSVRSLQNLLLLFLDKRDDFANKNEEFCNPSIKENIFGPTRRTTYGCSGPKDQQNKTDVFLHAFGVVLILLPLEGHKIFVASLVDPFLVDCIIFHQHSSTDCTGKFHDIHSIQGCLWWFYVCRL